MDEANDIYQQEIKLDEDDAFLPDGYAEGDDFFDPNTWTGDSSADSASATETEPEGEGNQGEAETEEAPAIEQTDETVPTDNGDDNGQVPATDMPEMTPNTKRRVRYQFDHEDREEEIDDADLPELLQKARSVDRYKQRLDSAQSVQDKLTGMARAMKYDSAEAFLDAIIDTAKNSEMEALRGRGVPDEMAEDFIRRKYEEAASVPPAPAKVGGHDINAEAEEFSAARPNVKADDIPEEVRVAWRNSDKTLLQVYMEYERKASVAEAEKAKNEAEKLRKENRILKNNADSADRAPVSGVSKGGRTKNNEADDPFLKGFDSDDW